VTGAEPEDVAAAEAALTKLMELWLQLRANLEKNYNPRTNFWNNKFFFL